MELKIENINLEELKKALSEIDNKSIYNLYTSVCQSTVLLLMDNIDEQSISFLQNEHDWSTKLNEGWTIESFILLRKPTSVVKKNLIDFIENNVDAEILKEHNIKVLLYDEDFGKAYTIIEDMFHEHEYDIEINDFDVDGEYLEDEYSPDPSDKKYNNESYEAYHMQGVFIEDELFEPEDLQEINDIEDELKL